MEFLIFLIVLGILVFVHELGHFLVAKRAGVRVDEFGLGYPPKALEIGRKWGTLFTLNWIPFGGFVKIFGEDYEEGKKEESEKEETISVVESAFSAQISPQEILTEEFIRISRSETNSGTSFVQVSKRWQAAILAAGITFNIIFAWFLFSLGFMIGLPTSVDNDLNMEVKNPALMITAVTQNSPAEEAGFKPGDKIIEVSNGKKFFSPADIDVDALISLISRSDQIFIKVKRGNEVFEFKATPKDGFAENKKAIGIGLDTIGTLSLPPHRAFVEGGKTTANLVYLTTEGIVGLIKNLFIGKADISQVTGPVGIVGLVGDASRLGFAYLITFTALISINLAIINLVPFPALDGGRIAMVAFEGVTGRSINPKFAHTLNTIGFFILIALMLVITYRDILKFF